MGTRDLIKRYFLRLTAVILPAGTLIVTVLATLMMVFGYRFTPFVMPVVCLVFGYFSLYVAVLEKRRARFYFSGSFLVMIGLLLLLIDYGFLELKLQKLWPVLVLFSGIALLPAGINRYHRAHPVYLVPAVTFMGLGTVFFLFTSDVITVPLRSFAVWWLPLALLPVIGVFLSSYFYRPGKAPPHDEQS